MQRRSRWTAVAIAIATALGSLGPSAVGASHIRGTALLPDLGMAPLENFSLQRRPRGGMWLRFDAIIVNVGDGPFQARGHTRQTNGELLVDQQLLTVGEDGSPSWSSAATAYRMYWSGDGHNHWHVRDLEGYTLRNTNPSEAPVMRTGAKHGFCFFDNYEYDLALTDAPTRAVYTRCGFTGADSEVTMGLSIGWGDRYNASLPDQYIDISGLPAGEYTITATADVQQLFTELDETNNSTTATIRINKKGVQVIDPGTGP
jgi:hypothetical protein